MDRPLSRSPFRFLSAASLPSGILLAVVMLLPILAASAVPASGTERLQPELLSAARFDRCGRAKRVTCIVDGDTFWFGGTKIRIADIDTPESHRPSCPAEAALAARATVRMQGLLNGGKFALAPSGDGRDTDYFGRSLRIVTRGGTSLGAVLVREGLADAWGGPRTDWCNPA
ncbi:hypothetical protein HME9302_00149 [Alteripontixanthobacter maritimus]|uniref:TNase-like domain-containing protein n=1 Tax=Alteripontixanthobacter maritimus TaxID=2161824 RepID=A0A369Q383_9SPHN|nr:thermonuclease family protein [Alteripontixanthobacter maritimus]RDC58972.1 hypothetical protein HME9302_00149 [Alteripontixanthobacter maritimus]